MKHIMIGLLDIMVGFASCTQVVKEEVKITKDTLVAVPCDGVLYHISSGIDNPHKVVMALSRP